MNTGIKHMEVEAAIADLKNRTLAGIPGEIARLIYLASTRDYNMGQYFHEGLASQFTEKIATAALAACHQETFKKLVFTPLDELLEQLEAYVRSTGARTTEVLRVWKKLEPYRVTRPLDSDPLSAELFFSNLRIAVAILQARQESGWDSPQCA